MKLIKNKKTEKENKSPLDYYFGKPRIEMAGSECLVDGLEKNNRIFKHKNHRVARKSGNHFLGRRLKNKFFYT